MQNQGHLWHLLPHLVFSHAVTNNSTSKRHHNHYCRTVGLPQDYGITLKSVLGCLGKFSYISKSPEASRNDNDKWTSSAWLWPSPWQLWLPLASPFETASATLLIATGRSQPLSYKDHQIAKESNSRVIRLCIMSLVQSNENHQQASFHIPRHACCSWDLFKLESSWSGLNRL